MLVSKILSSLSKKVIYFPLAKLSKGMEFIEILNSSPDSDKLIEQWVIQNLKSRYYIGKHIKVSKTDNLIHSFLVGFEDPKEMSIFKRLKHV